MCRYLGVQGELFQRGEGKKGLPVWQRRRDKPQSVHSFQQEAAVEGVKWGTGWTMAGVSRVVASASGGPGRGQRKSWESRGEVVERVKKGAWRRGA